MSNIHNQEQLENQFDDILDQVYKWDSKGLLETQIRDVVLAYAYGLHQDDDRDEILQFIAESILNDNYEVASI
jgi:hypothetical protein